MRRPLLTSILLALGAVGALAACTLSFDLGPAPQVDGGADSPSDVAAEGAVKDAGAPTFDDPNRWSVRVVPELADTIGWGAAFDPVGRYLYLPRERADAAPLLGRYAVDQPFADASIATQTFTGDSMRYVAGAYEQQTMLFVPDLPGTVAVRFPSSDFGDPSKWSMDPVGGSKTTFRGLAVSPKCVFAAPSNASTKIASRCGTTAVAWTTNGAGPGPLSHGAVAGPDGFFYFAPVASSVVVRGAATQTMDDGGLESYDTTLADAGPVGLPPTFGGVVAAGKAIYFLPGAGSDGVVLRYDTDGAFAKPSSWSRHTIAGSGGFFGGVFDGRFLYLVPARDLKVVRYDTTKSIDTGWEATTLTGVPQPSIPDTFHAGAYDGRYVYFVGAEGGVVVRFDTLPDRDGGSEGGAPAPSFL